MSGPCWACVCLHMFVQAVSHTHKVPLDVSCSLVLSCFALDGMLISDGRNLVIHL